MTSLQLDGTWDFFPGDHDLADLPALPIAPIHVPGLWEAQGWPDLDGPAWYRRSFACDDPRGWWTLLFGGVMDTAEVYLNGHRLGDHEGPYTPFELDPAPALRVGENVLCVRVDDPPADHPDHLRMPHGKQGWYNDVFPSPPSLYATYGGIWLPVTLRRHGPVAVRDAFVNGDPQRLTVTVEVDRRSGAETTVEVRTLGRTVTVDLPAGQATVSVCVGAVDAPQWTPEQPVLHEATVTAIADGDHSDVRTVRYGLRTVRMVGQRIEVNGVPYRMRSALVQGFYPETLYAEPGRAAIEREVRAAQQVGLNTLRLHIKGFDPTYLDVCDELGMFVHCDLPVAEPIAHAELDDTGLLADRCDNAVLAQVRRDRNHPSVILWSAMNELGCLDEKVRLTDGYERFVRRLYRSVDTADGTRPVIENDWIVPDPDRVFCSPLLTTHWYGRLDSTFLADLDQRTGELSSDPRPLLASEFGDWGLPALDPRTDPPFWWYGDRFTRDIEALAWPGTVAEFVAGTQHYQGLSDRFQAEVYRRHEHVAGWCLTELTDVPQEFNGLFDLERREKPAAIAEVARVCQPVLPILVRPHWSIGADELLEARAWIANDGPAVDHVTLVVELAEELLSVPVGRLPEHSPIHVGAVRLRAPRVHGMHQLIVRIVSADQTLAENAYPVHVVPEESLPPQPDDLLVVGEGMLDAAAGVAVAEALAAQRPVLVLAQPPEAAVHLPFQAELRDVAQGWGSTTFHFTTDEPGLPSLPPCRVLTTELMSILPTVLYTGLDPVIGARTLVGAWKPAPDPAAGLVVGDVMVGAGKLIFCQLPLAGPAASGDAAATAVLADLFRLAAAASR